MPMEQSGKERADITKAIFDAFRQEHFGIGAYFSKADWHCPRTTGIRIVRDQSQSQLRRFKEPERWERFVKFTHGQIRELCSNYGPLDILWLDAGQVQKANRQDIRIDEIVADAQNSSPT